MTPHDFRRQRETLGLSRWTMATLLGVTVSDIFRCERRDGRPAIHPFVLDLAMAYAELELEWSRSAATVPMTTSAARASAADGREAAAI